MKTMLKMVIFMMLLAVTSCATPEATWKSIPDSRVPYERAWNIVVNAVTQHFEIETVDGQSGYLKTSWKVTHTSIFGDPMERARATVRVEERSPFRVKVKVEREQFLFGQWQSGGNEEKLENDIMSELDGRLR